MPDLTVADLLEALDGLDPDTPVRLAHQPSWPFEYSIRSAEIIEETPKGGYDLDGDETVVYLVEGAQTRYLPGQVADAIGWGNQ